jgi:hypothetical protein
MFIKTYTHLVIWKRKTNMKYERVSYRLRCVSMGREPRLSAHERFIHSLSNRGGWLLLVRAETVKRKSLFTFSSQLREGFCWVGCCIVLLQLRARTKRRNTLWLHPLLSKRLRKGKFHLTVQCRGLSPTAVNILPRSEKKIHDVLFTRIEGGQSLATGRLFHCSRAHSWVPSTPLPRPTVERTSTARSRK